MTINQNSRNLHKQKCSNAVCSTVYLVLELNAFALVDFVNDTNLDANLFATELLYKQKFINKFKMIYNCFDGCS